jgi:O-acetylhomoserine (thiol)-lyase
MSESNWQFMTKLVGFRSLWYPQSMTASNLPPKELHVDTRLLHADRRSKPEHGAVHKPLHTSSTFNYERAEDLVAVFQGSQAGYIYARQGNPTTAALEQQITLLEQGSATASFATGMAAITAIFISLLRSGDHVVSSQFLFGNTNSLFQTMEAFGVQFSFVDATDATQVAAAIKPNTRMVFVETIANPRTQVSDLVVIGEICAQRKLVYVVDSTLTTPILLKPKIIGASLVVHSLTKSISGHGNAMGGSVTDTGLYDWSNYPHIYDSYKKGPPSTWGILQIKKKGLRDMGATLRAEDAHRISVGAETMRLRVPAASHNALQVAQFLEAQPGIGRVYYPGLESHEQHQRSAQLFSGLFGTLLSFELKPELHPLDFLNRLKIVILSSHLSDTRTLAIPVAQTIYWEMGATKRQAMGISDGLIRLSVGIEALEDLLDDLAQALRAP